MIGISETWWKEDNQWDTVIPGYKLYGNDRTDQIDGGVVLYVREGLRCKKGKGKVMAMGMF